MITVSILMRGGCIDAVKASEDISVTLIDADEFDELKGDDLKCLEEALERHAQLPVVAL